MVMTTSTAAIKHSAKTSAGKPVLRIAVILGWLAAVTASASTVVGPWTPIFKGIDHLVGTNTPGSGGFPELQVVHAVRVDLTDPDIQLLATPPIDNHALQTRETGGLSVGQLDVGRLRKRFRQDACDALPR